MRAAERAAEMYLGPVGMAASGGAAPAHNFQHTVSYTETYRLLL